MHVRIVIPLSTMWAQVNGPIGIVRVHARRAFEMIVDMLTERDRVGARGRAWGIKGTRPVKDLSSASATPYITKPRKASGHSRNAYPLKALSEERLDE